MSMEQVCILLVTLAGVTHAAETKCNLNNNTSFCSVTLGGSVFVQIMTNTSGHQLWCKKQLPIGSMNVFSLKKEKVMIQDAYKNRTEFFISNGTLKIADVERNDSGQYSIEVFDPNGIQVKNIILTLDVQESILPTLVLVCSAVGAVLIVAVISCCIYRKVKHKKKSVSGK